MVVCLPRLWKEICACSLGKCVSLCHGPWSHILILPWDRNTKLTKYSWFWWLDVTLGKKEVKLWLHFQESIWGKSAVQNAWFHSKQFFYLNFFFFFKEVLQIYESLGVLDIIENATCWLVQQSLCEDCTAADHPNGYRSNSSIPSLKWSPSVNSCS